MNSNNALLVLRQQYLFFVFLHFSSSPSSLNSINALLVLRWQCIFFIFLHFSSSSFSLLSLFIHLFFLLHPSIPFSDFSSFLSPTKSPHSPLPFYCLDPSAFPHITSRPISILSFITFHHPWPINMDQSPCTWPRTCMQCLCMKVEIDTARIHIKSLLENMKGAIAKLWFSVNHVKSRS